MFCSQGSARRIRAGAMVLAALALSTSSVAARDIVFHEQHFFVPKPAEVCGSLAWRGLMRMTGPAGLTDFHTFPYFGSSVPTPQPHPGPIHIVGATAMGANQGLHVRVSCIGLESERSLLTVQIAGDRDSMESLPGRVADNVLTGMYEAEDLDSASPGGVPADPDESGSAPAAPGINDLLRGD